MGLFGRFVCENESFSSMKKALSSSPDELWDEYKAMDKRLQEAEANLACERNIRIDTEKRCAELYHKLCEAQDKVIQLSNENKAQVNMITTLEAAVSSLQSAVITKSLSMERLARICFGKKSEKLRKCLGEKGYDLLSSLLKQHMSGSTSRSHVTDECNSSTPDETNRNETAQTDTGTEPSKSMFNNDASVAGTVSDTAMQTESDNDGENNADGDRETETGRDPKKNGCSGKGTDGRKKKKGNKNLARRSGFLDSYCAPDSGCVYEVQDFYYTEDEIRTILNHDGSTKHISISSNISTYQTLEFFPGFYYMKTHVVPSLKSGDTLMRAPRLDRILNASAASPSSLSHAAFWKYRQGLPVNAICSQAESEGAKIERGTMSGWLTRGYEKLLFPMHMYLLQCLKKRGTVMGDETYTYARDEKRDLHTCYYWGIRTSPLDDSPNQIVFFAFDDSRMSLVPSFYLHGFSGKLLTDGYVGYEVFDESDGSIIRCCCWVHARRTVIEVLPGSKTLEECPEKVKEKIWAWQALCILTEIFSYEKKYRDMDAETRAIHRMSEMAPLVDQFYELAKELSASDSFDSVSEEGKAINYFISRETELRRMLEDGSIPLSTNDLERCNIIVALVRKRAKIFDSEKGAKSAAGYFTLIETAEANGVDAEQYLEFLFDIMPSVLYEHKSEIENYLDYHNKAMGRLEAAKEKKRKNPSAKVEIDWSDLEEPDLSFLMLAAPWSEACRIYVEKNGKAAQKKEIMEMLTRQNMKNSPLCPEILNRIIHTEKNLADKRLDGLRDILEPMISNKEFDSIKDRYKNGLVYGIKTHKTYLPERLLEESEQLPASVMTDGASSIHTDLSVCSVSNFNDDEKTEMTSDHVSAARDGSSRREQHAVKKGGIGPPGNAVYRTVTA